MKQKQDKRTLLGALALILLSATLLTGSMVALAAELGESKPYQRSELVDEDLILGEGTPNAQSELRKKFDTHLHEEVQPDGSIALRLFSKEQSAALAERKKAGERFYLTYDEVMFLINDSVRLYESYSHLILTDAAPHGLVVDPDSRPDRVIETAPTEGNLTYKQELAAAAARNRDLITLIRYRIGMLDSALLEAEAGIMHFSGRPSTIALRFGDETLPFEPLEPLGRVRLLLIDEGAVTDLATSQSLMRRELDVGVSQIPNGDYRSSYPLLVFWEDRIEVYEDGEISLCFPTAIHTPTWELKPSYFDTDLMTVTLRKLGDDTVSLKLGSFSGEVLAEVMTKLGDREALIFEVENLLEQSYEKDFYYYELDLNNGTVILLPVDHLADEAEDTTYGVITAYGETYEACVFRPYLPRAFAHEVRELAALFGRGYVIP